MARVSSKYSNNEIVEYSTILIIEFGFGKNTLTEERNRIKDQRSEEEVYWQPIPVNQVNQKQKGKKELSGVTP